MGNHDPQTIGVKPIDPFGHLHLAVRSNISHHQLSLRESPGIIPSLPCNRLSTWKYAHSDNWLLWKWQWVVWMTTYKILISEAVPSCQFLIASSLLPVTASFLQPVKCCQLFTTSSFLTIPYWQFLITSSALPAPYCKFLTGSFFITSSALPAPYCQFLITSSVLPAPNCEFLTASFLHPWYRVIETSLAWPQPTRTRCSLSFPGILIFLPTRQPPVSGLIYLARQA